MFNQLYLALVKELCLVKYKTGLLRVFKEFIRCFKLKTQGNSVEVSIDLCKSLHYGFLKYPVYINFHWTMVPFPSYSDTYIELFLVCRDSLGFFKMHLLPLQNFI